MKLIYIYLCDYKKIRNAEFNFCSDIEILAVHNDESSMTLVSKDHKRLPDNFFSAVPGRAGVDSASCLIGANGSCKTSFAQLFYDLGRKNDEKPEAVVVIEVEGSLRVFTSMHRKIKCEFDDAPDVKPEAIGSESFEFPLSFVYYSPYYTTESLVATDRPRFFDCSTSGLMRNPTERAKGLLEDGLNIVQVHDAEDWRRSLEFVSDYFNQVDSLGKTLDRDEPLVRFAIRHPNAVVLRVLDESVEHAKRLFRKEVNRIRAHEHRIGQPVRNRLATDASAIENPVGRLLDDVLPVFNNYKTYDFTHRAFLAFVAMSWRTGDLLKKNDVAPRDVSIGQFLRSKFGTSARGNMCGDIYDFLTRNAAEFGYAYKVFMLLSELEGRFDVDKKGCVKCDFRGKSTMDKVAELVLRIKSICGAESFLEVKIEPRMSSGEMSYIALWGRLIEQLHDAACKNNVILFLDEIETTLHPSLQRELVEQVILFVQLFSPSKHVQLVFASHSPLILSDMPTGNVVLLEENQQTGEVKPCKLDSNVKGGCFAANIYDLYRIPFVMRDGLIGSFACAKLRPFVTPDPKNPLSLEDRKLILDLVGDLRLKAYLSREESVR